MSPVRTFDTEAEIAETLAVLRAERQKRQEAEERLRRKQEEFDDFVLTALHDLKEPLRSISAYSELLAVSALHDDRRETEQTDQYRRCVAGGTTKIEALISGIVDCVNAASPTRYLVSVDMKEVFREAESVAFANSNLPRAVVTLDAQPVFRGDHQKLTRIAQNLFDNAARYCERPDCRIHVSTTLADDCWTFRVKDNGPGIEAAWREQIFAPFRRLHGREYSGCGLGLTYCRRAAESFGGRVWVESEPGNGSTFCFTVPAV